MKRAPSLLHIGQDEERDPGNDDTVDWRMETWICSRGVQLGRKALTEIASSREWKVDRLIELAL